MTATSKFIAEIAGATLTLLTTFLGLWWFLRSVVGLSQEGTVVLLAPAVPIVGLAAIYGLYVRWERDYSKYHRAGPAVTVIEAVRLLLFAGAIGVLSFGVLYFLWQGRLVIAFVIAIVHVSVLTVGVIRFNRSLADDHRAALEGRAAYHASGAFERRFRIFVFSLALGMPAGCALIFLAIGDSEVAVVMAILTVAVAPFMLRRIAAERRRGG